MKSIAAVTTLVLASLTTLLTTLTVEAARLPYENGRYFDLAEGVVHHDEAILGYGLLALVFGVGTAIAVWCTFRLWKRR